MAEGSRCVGTVDAPRVAVGRGGPSWDSVLANEGVGSAVRTSVGLQGRGLAPKVSSEGGTPALRFSLLPNRKTPRLGAAAAPKKRDVAIPVVTDTIFVPSLVWGVLSPSRYARQGRRLQDIRLRTLV